NAGGSTPATSAATPVVTALVAAAPVNLTPPAITGTAQVGNTLTVSNGTWSNSPTSYGYQWARCDSAGGNCAAISGATSNSYALTSSDAGATLRNTVTATNSGGSTAATSAVTAATAAPSSSTTTYYTLVSKNSGKCLD